MIRSPYKDFLDSLESEVRRLSPSFTISSKAADPLLQVLETLRSCVSVLLRQKENIENEYSKLSKTSSIKTNESSNELTQNLNKLLIAQKELQKFEELLIDRQSQIELREEEHGKKSSILIQKTKNFEIEKTIMEKKTNELEIRIQALQEKEKSLNREIKNFQMEKESAEYEKFKIQEFKEKIEKNYKESEKIREVNLKTQENLQADLQKFEIENRIFEDKSQSIALKLDYIEKQQEELDRKKKNLEDQAMRLSKEKEQVQAIKQKISDERLILHEENQNLEKTRKFVENKLIEFKSCTSKTEPNETKDLGRLFEKLKRQIDVFNHEVYLKEKKIAEDRASVQKDHEKNMKAYEKIMLAERKLKSLYQEILEFYQEISNFQSNFPKVADIQETFHEKAEEFYALSKRMEQNLGMISEIGKSERNDSGRTEENQTSSMEIQKLQIRNKIEAKRLEDLAQELQEKLRKLEKKQKQVEIQALENVKVAETFKIAQETLISDRVQLENKERKCNSQLKSLETAFRKLENKRQEFSAFKSELDKKQTLLNLKEKELENKF